jgi:metal-sulfur cluster biosynthetic enzyme
MGDSIASDAQRKIERVPGVASALVEVVWDPPWTPERISPAGKELLGLG